MTRFARIKGAKKPSFNKIEEEATSWEEMKQPVKEESESEEDEDEKESKDEIAPKEEKVSTIWSVFEEDVPKKSKNKIKGGDKPNKKRPVDDNLESPVKPKKQKKKQNDQEDRVAEAEEDAPKKSKKKNKPNDGDQQNKIRPVDNLESSVKPKKHKKKQNDQEDTEAEDGAAKKSKKKNKPNDGDQENKIRPVDNLESPVKPKKQKKKHEQEDTVTEAVVKQENGIGADPKKNMAEKKSKSKKRRKPDEGDQSIIIDGKDVKLTRFDGFFVTEADAERLTKLRSDLQKKGLPPNKVKAMVKKDRRNAERFLSKIRRKLCFHCRESGHNLTECPKLSSKGTPTAGAGICYKCGSTEHAMFQCKVPGNELKFATCFICKETGHLSKNCPDNPRGLYPQGGGCRNCGDVTHLQRDCPRLLNKKSKQVTVGTINNAIEALDEDVDKNKTKKEKNHFNQNKKKIVKFT